MKMILQQLQQAQKQVKTNNSRSHIKDLDKKIKMAKAAYHQACIVLEKMTGISLKKEK